MLCKSKFKTCIYIKKHHLGSRFAVHAGSELGPLESSRHHCHGEQTSKEKPDLLKRPDPRQRITIQAN